MIYYNMASGFQNRIADPLFVENKYSDEAFYSDIELTSHVGQECDLVIRGSMKVQVGGHTELLHEGDCIYYDSSIPHGMVAADGQDCLFYAIVLRPQEPSLPEAGGDRAAMIETAQSPDPEARIYTRFVDAPEDANGKLQSIAFKMSNPSISHLTLWMRWAVKSLKSSPCCMWLRMERSGGSHSRT